jgi:hypothetical protein
VADASDPSAVARLEGQFAIVAGRVRHVGATRDRYWIDFGDDWRSDVTVVVPKAESPRFLAAGLGVGALGGARIRVRGIVTIKDGPRLDVTEPAAIERLTDG